MNLIVLPCHSIWKSGDTLGQSRDEWYLAPFQIEGYDHLSFIEHIEKSIDILNQDPHSYLIISGGKTKNVDISEAQSYFDLMKRLNKGECSRIGLEEFARDSFENVLFSICKYYSVFKRLPNMITIVGFEFKRDRFVNNHLNQALNFPLDRIKYIGNMPCPKDLNSHQLEAYFQDLYNSEYKHAVSHFEKDWYGVLEPLSTKKQNRDPFNANPIRANLQLVQNHPILTKILESIQESDIETIRKMVHKLDYSI